MISTREQIRDAFMALRSYNPSDWMRGGRELNRLTCSVTVARLVDAFAPLLVDEGVDGEAVSSTPVDTLPPPTIPSRTPLRNIVGNARRNKVVVTAEQVLKTMKPHEHEITRSDARFAMIQAAADNLVAHDWDRMNVPSRDLCQNIASWRGASISRAQVEWLRNCERAVKRRIA